MGRPLMSPDGCRIRGTLETVTGVALIEDGSLTRTEDGEVVFQHSGSTDIFWDEQKTVQRSQQVVFLDDDGHQWLEEELVETPEEEVETQLYDVIVTADVTESTTIRVSAASVEEANQKALDLARLDGPGYEWTRDDGNPSWKPYIGDPEGAEVVTEEAT